MQLAELRPKTEKTMRQTSVAAVAMTTLIYALISLGSYLVFGRGTQSDVLHNYTPTLLQHIAPHWLAETLYIVVRLSFLLGVLTLFPLMVRVKIFSEICVSLNWNCQNPSRKEKLCAIVYSLQAIQVILILKRSCNFYTC